MGRCAYDARAGFESVEEDLVFIGECAEWTGTYGVHWAIETGSMFIGRPMIGGGEYE